MKKYIIAAVVAVAVFASAAFAASLDVNAGKLQAGQAGIGTCISEDVDVRYSEPAFANPGWTVSQITLDHFGECDGLDYSVVVTGAGEDGPWSTDVETGTFDGDPELVSFNPGFDAEGASDVHLVIRTATSTP
jgi:opacity protein-like surface antigen